MQTQAAKPSKKIVAIAKQFETYEVSDEAHVAVKDKREKFEAQLSNFVEASRGTVTLEYLKEFSLCEKIEKRGAFFLLDSASRPIPLLQERALNTIWDRMVPALEGYLTRHAALVVAGKPTSITFDDLMFQVNQTLDEVIAETGHAGVSVPTLVGCYGMGKNR